MSAPLQPLLDIQDVAVHYGGVRAVDGLTFNVPAGQIFGIIGPNGSGKSTLIAALTRLVRLTRGAMLLDGEPYRDVPPNVVARLGLGRTFQTVRLLGELTIEQNVMLGSDVHRVGQPALDRAAAHDVVYGAIERLGLQAYVGLRPGQVSYGIQRRVEIARALAARPRVLLLDEPTAGMNHSERDEISRLLLELRKTGLTQILVEHDVQMMIDTCDRVLAMNFGRQIAEGTPVDVVRDPAVQEAYMGTKKLQHA